MNIPASLRKLVVERAKGCCEYCGYPEAASYAPHEIDHIIAQKHGGANTEDNLALSCTLCNKHKGSDLTSIDPETNLIEPLFHPRQDRWPQHFQLVGGTIQPLTAKGRVTVRLLKFNEPARIKERKLLIETGFYPFTQNL
jgi:HNH endonuclease